MVRYSDSAQNSLNRKFVGFVLTGVNITVLVAYGEIPPVSWLSPSK